MKELIENISTYLELRVELMKVELQESLAELASRLIVLTAMVIFVFLGMMAATIGLGQYLNKILDSSYLGYVAITGVYFFVVLLLYSLNRYFKLGRALKLYILRILEKDNI